MLFTIVNAVGQARLDDLHQQAQRDALARAARRARGHQHRHPAPGLLAVIARRPRRPRPALQAGACGNEGGMAG